eukprot:scaffold46893_cov49-Prasinocladus_malaysianus.AAC.1
MSMPNPYRPGVRFKFLTRRTVRLPPYLLIAADDTKVLRHPRTGIAVDYLIGGRRADMDGALAQDMAEITPRVQ